MNDVPMLKRAFHQLVNQHLSTRRDPDELASAVVDMYGTLLKILSPLLGNMGSQALFRRTLNLTEGAFPCYGEARKATDKVLLEAVGTCLRQQKLDIAREASVALLVAFVELLATFIGERLTCQLLEEAWPDILIIPSEETHQ